MGFSTVAGFLIILITVVAIFGVLIHVAVTDLKELGRFYRYVPEKSKFEVVKVYANGLTSNTYELSIIVKNTGSKTLNCKGFSILVDGEMVNCTSNVTKLYPLKSADFYCGEIYGDVNSSHRLLVVSEDGVKVFYQFEVR